MPRALRRNVVTFLGVCILILAGVILFQTLTTAAQVSQTQIKQCRYLIQRNAFGVQFWTKYAAVQNHIAIDTPSKQVAVEARELARLDKSFAEVLRTTPPDKLCGDAIASASTATP